MVSSAAQKTPRSNRDRRWLPRFETGRRNADRAAEVAVTEADEARLGQTDSAIRYILLLVALSVIVLLGVRAGNIAFAPMLNDPRTISETAKIAGTGQSYHTYDLNIETRQLRADHIGNLPAAPYAAVMGASHWQEGHSDLAGGADFYNAHVHRDYYEDILGVIEMFVRHDRLPETLLITLRDNLFTPVEARTDFLWVPILPYYRAMADRLGIEAHTHYADGLTPQLRQRLSVPLLKANVHRYLRAPIQPHASSDRDHPTLDTLLPDGSIRWSDVHQRGFTRARARTEAMGFALSKRNEPPVIDPAGVKAVDAAFAYLAERGVRVYLTHPPFNPVYWSVVQDTPYMEGLARVEQLTRDLAARHGFEVIGGFDPAPLGCTPDMYIDGEHSNPECLGALIRLFLDETSRPR